MACRFMVRKIWSHKKQNTNDIKVFLQIAMQTIQEPANAIHQHAEPTAVS